MNKILNLDKMDFAYWINGIPNTLTNSESNEVIRVLGADKSLNYTLRVALELSLHRHTSSYALLGFEYVPEKNVNSLTVSIKYNDKNEMNYLSQIRPITSCK